MTLIAGFTVVDPITDVATDTDPTTVAFRVKLPAGTTTVYTWPVPLSAEITHVGAGSFLCSFAIDDPGTWRARVEGTGACKAAGEDAFDVEESDVL